MGTPGTKLRGTQPCTSPHRFLTSRCQSPDRNFKSKPKYIYILNYFICLSSTGAVPFLHSPLALRRIRHLEVSGNWKRARDGEGPEGTMSRGWGKPRLSLLLGPTILQPRMGPGFASIAQRWGKGHRQDPASGFAGKTWPELQLQGLAVRGSTPSRLRAVTSPRTLTHSSHSPAAGTHLQQGGTPQPQAVPYHQPLSHTEHPQPLNSPLHHPQGWHRGGTKTPCHPTQLISQWGRGEEGPAPGTLAAALPAQTPAPGGAGSLIVLQSATSRNTGCQIPAEQ